MLSNARKYLPMLIDAESILHLRMHLKSGTLHNTILRRQYVPAQNFHWQVRLARHESDHAESLFERQLSPVPTKRAVKYLFQPLVISLFQHHTILHIQFSLRYLEWMQIIILKLENKHSEVFLYCTMRADTIYDAIQSALSTEIKGKRFIIMDSKHNRKARYIITSLIAPLHTTSRPSLFACKALVPSLVWREKPYKMHHISLSTWT